MYKRQIILCVSRVSGPKFIFGAQKINVGSLFYENSKTICMFNLSKRISLVKGFSIHLEKLLISSNANYNENQIELNGYGFMIFSVNKE